MTSLSTVLRSSAFRWAVGGWSFFIAENVVLSENRSLLIEHLGDDGYHAAYGTLSTAAMASVAYAYMTKLGSPVSTLAMPSLPHRVAAMCVLSLGLGMASQTLPKFQLPVTMVTATTANNNNTTTTNDSSTHGFGVGPSPSPVAAPKNTFKVQCPFDFTDKPSGDSNNNNVRGLERISRHPGLWSMGLVGVGHSFLVPHVPKKAWLCMPLLVAFVGGAHTDSRYRRGMGGTLTKERDEATSNVPFWAMMQRGGWTELMQELKPLNAAMAVGVAGVWVWRTGRVPKARVMGMTR
jgi:hypothetical protein